ncbi:hypothetical protein GH714_024439 [Hevea brasiliensis]|uniref:Uncharacterized protein n=1 Tax=Hevea brasiliensis TaxID=3981 RepID=A0A6A6N7H8_HEVBR|nr:hypothetical protein GH714_024439 [Hevea brasiliensis]
MAEMTGLIMKGAVALGSAAVAGKLYEDGRSLIGPSLGEMKELAQDIEANYQMMKGTAELLKGKREDILGKIKSEKEHESTDECNAWINRAKELEAGVQILDSKYSTEKDKGLWSFDLSKALKKKLEELRQWLEEGRKIVVSVERKPPRIIRVPAPKIEDKSSLNAIFEKMTACFRDDQVKIIGLWGKVGVGKTAIMENLNNKEKLRWEIARRLKLKIEPGTPKSEINFIISEQLEKKKCLFLLDDVQHVFKLNDIGIYNINRNNKVILASRNQNICWAMDSDEIVEVEELPIEEAVVLFKEKLGPQGKRPQFEQVAKLVVEHCSCLPLLIEKVAGFFKCRARHNWTYLLKNFQNWLYNDFDGMVEVLKKIRFCFERLDHKDKKHCFLYCALHTEGCEISTNHLVECCKAEDFFPDVGTGHGMVDDLINASLLEKAKKKKCVKMNKVLRNMALKILSEWDDLKFLVKAGVLVEPLSDMEWEDAKRISLMDNGHRLRSLPEEPNCAKLRTLFLQRSFALTAIPDDFFRFMQDLRVLDLHGTKVEKLPSPFHLKCLQVLYLSCDQLMELPSRMKLENLEVLDIRGTRIYCLPVQISNMKKLRCLRISFSNVDGESDRAEEHLGVISNLSLLEELVLEVKAQNQWWNHAMKNITREVATLTKLTSLLFCFYDEESFKTFLDNSKWWQNPNFTLQICVGQHDSIRRLKSENAEYKDNAIISSLVVVITNDTYELIGHKEAWSISNFGIENINELKCCIIEGCKEIRTVIDATETMEGVLEQLEKIYISNVPMLESIWEGNVPDGSLAQLTVFCLYDCSNLKTVFSSAMIKQLSKLQHLQIEDCPKIEQLIVESENDGLEQLELPCLTTLVLRNLPVIESIWKNDLICPHLGPPVKENCEQLHVEFSEQIDGVGAVTTVISNIRPIS